MSSRFPAALLLLGMLWACPLDAWAQMYRWTDERGQTHYSQGLDSVPERYRSGATPLEYRSLPSEPSFPAAATAPTGVARIPFTPGRPIMVNARVNGAGTVNLMLDTGATITLINPRALAALGVSNRTALRGAVQGVTGRSNVLYVIVETLEVGEAKFGPLRVAAHDAELRFGDGLLGRDFLDQFNVTIDNKAGVVILAPK